MTAMATTILMLKRERGTGLYSWGSRQWIWNLEKHSPTGSKIREAKYGRATDCGLGKPLTHRRQNPSYGFWTRKTTHPRGAKSGWGKLPAADLELGKPVTQLMILRTLKRKRCLGNCDSVDCLAARNRWLHREEEAASTSSFTEERDEELWKTCATILSSVFLRREQMTSTLNV